MSEPKQITRAEMAALLDRECPGMSTASRQACLTGTVLELGDGRRFRAPVDDDGRATHHAVMRIQKVGETWIDN